MQPAHPGKGDRWWAQVPSGERGNRDRTASFVHSGGARPDALQATCQETAGASLSTRPGSVPRGVAVGFHSRVRARRIFVSGSRFFVGTAAELRLLQRKRMSDRTTRVGRQSRHARVVTSGEPLRSRASTSAEPRPRCSRCCVRADFVLSAADRLPLRRSRRAVAHSTRAGQRSHNRFAHTGRLEGRSGGTPGRHSRA